MGLTSNEAKALCDRILGLVKADDAEVWLSDSADQHLRYANNDITSNSLTRRVDVSLSVSYGKRSASISTNQTSDAALREAVEKVQAMAKLAPEDPEHLPPVEPGNYADPITWAEDTAKASPGDAIEWIRPVIEQARAARVDSAGYLKRSVGGFAQANSKGLFVHQRGTSVGFSLTARTTEGNGSGWASTQVTDVRDLDLAPVGKRAIEKALASRNPDERAPGRTTVVLEPAAVRDLLSLLIWSLDRRSYDEGRSFLNSLVPEGGNPIGAELFGTNATLISDPLYAAAPCATHSGGLPLTRTPWVENGVLKNLEVGRFWAQQKGLSPQPGPGNLIMPGDGASMDELIGQVEDGVLITRLWYLRMVQPQNLLYTGLTRDGTFAIKQGKIAGPVKNFRFNESPVNVLKQIVSSGVPARVLGSESDMPFHVPPLVVENFNLSSVSDAS
ncbi:MAG: TldD/PmbA family protein [Verrucomicrobiae bacterium]|nr:TldD/PmbA family protein [Verrucomicrobiae bacterium]